MNSLKTIIISVLLCFVVFMCGNSGKGNAYLDIKLKAVLETKNGSDAYTEMTDIATKYEIDKGYKSLTPIGKLLYNVFWIEGEVNNGGFNQYFYNSSGDHTMDAIEGLNNIGATQTKELLQSAIDKFPNSIVPTNRDERIKALENIDPDNSVFNDLNSRFYDLEEDIADLTIQYIKPKLQ
jgi:hypothetical protein